MAEPALNPEVPQTGVDSNHLVAFHMNRIRGLVKELRQLVPGTVYDMDISWHPAAKIIAQEVVTACRKEDISATYEPPNKSMAKYQIRINLQRVVCDTH